MWADGKVSWDLSNIDGYPFAAQGIEIIPSMQNDTNNPTCAVVDCLAGEADCTEAYN